MVRFENSGPKVTGKEIKAFESRTKLSLPDSYKEFLLSTNGGELSPSEFFIPDADESALVDVLYRIRDERVPGDLEYEYSNTEIDLPKGFIAIGHDPGGNILLLGLKDKHRGQIYYWDSSHFFACSDSKGNTYFLANSIAEFLQKLKPSCLVSLFCHPDVFGPLAAVVRESAACARAAARNHSSDAEERSTPLESD